MKALEDFRALLEHMKKRPAMYVNHGEYNLLSILLDGYLICFRQMTGLDLASDFRQWVQAKYKRHFAIHEAACILHFVAKDDKEVAFKKLFKHWNEFLDAYHPTK